MSTTSGGFSFSPRSEPPKVPLCAAAAALVSSNLIRKSADAGDAVDERLLRNGLNVDG